MFHIVECWVLLLLLASSSVDDATCWTTTAAHQEERSGSMLPDSCLTSMIRVLLILLVVVPCCVMSVLCFVFLPISAFIMTIDSKKHVVFSDLALCRPRDARTSFPPNFWRQLFPAKMFSCLCKSDDDDDECCGLWLWNALLHCWQNRY